MRGIKATISQKGPNVVNPIEVLVYNGEAIVVNEHHTIQAFRELGYKRVPIKYVTKNYVKRTYGWSITDIIEMKHK